MIQIIPAIDIIDGKCVRLRQGDYGQKTEYDATPEEMALAYADAGVKRIHLVDLDGAKAGCPKNLAVLERIAGQGKLRIEWGGGVKTQEDLRRVIDAGAHHVIIGSLAVKEPKLMERMLREHGGRKIVLGADLRKGKVAVSGWIEDSSLTIHDLLDRYMPLGLKEAIVTDISKDGMLQGPSTELYTNLARRYPDVVFTVSGGISSMDDIENLDRLGLDRVIVGKAIYEGRISLEEIKDFIGRTASADKK